MKYILVLVFLVGNLFWSSADVTFEESHHEQIKIISISQADSKFIIDAEKLAAETGAIKISTEELKQTRDGEIDFNAGADSIISSIANQIFMGNGDPADLDGREITFEYKPLLITYTGTLKLTNGFIQDLSSVSRRDDAVISYTLGDSLMKVSVPISFNTIVAGYNFEMNVRGDTVNGVLFAWVDGVTADYNAQIDSSTMTVISTEFSLNFESLDIDVYSSSISSSYKNLVNELTENLMRETVIDQINAIIGEALNSSVLSAVGAS